MALVMAYIRRCVYHGGQPAAVLNAQKISTQARVNSRLGGYLQQPGGYRSFIPESLPPKLPVPI